MFTYIIRRILATIPVMAVVAVFVFALLHLSPGDPAAIIAGDTATAADIARIRAQLGLDQPIYVQFVGWLLIALWLYARGFEDRSNTVAALGSLAAACAIGTRQFGMALISGPIIAWMVSRPATRPPVERLLWAILLPVAVAAWQVLVGLSEPNFTQAVRLHEQAYFLSRPLPDMAHEIGWRLSTVLQYLGLCLLPVLPVLASLSWDRARSFAATHATGASSAPPDGRSRSAIVLFALATLAGLLLFSTTTSDISTRANAGRVLPLWWMLPTMFWNKTWLMRGFAAAGVLGAFFLLVLFWRWQGKGPRLRDMSWSALLSGTTGVSLFVFHLSYVQLNDTYLVGLLPFVLLLMGAALARRPQPAWVLATTALWSFAMVVLLSAWMRGDYNRQQAQWAAADRLVASGTPARCIGATRHWSEYNGAFDDWLAAKYPNFDHRRGARSPAPPGPMHVPFYAWLETRSWNGTYQLTSGLGEALRPGWKVITEVPYRNAWFAVRWIQVLERQTPQPPDAEPCPRGAVRP